MNITPKTIQKLERFVKTNKPKLIDKTIKPKNK